MRGANCGTDHQLLRSRVIFSIRKKHNQKLAMKPVKLNTSKLKNTSHAESLVQEMDNALAQSSEDNKTPCWTSFQQVVYDTAKASPGKYEKKHQDWFDSNDQILRDLMAKRGQAHQRVLQIRSTRSVVEAYKDACRILQKYTRARKSDWWELKAEELQRASDRNDMKGFYSGLKEVWGSHTKQPVHLKSSDGLEIFTDRKCMMAGWREYFQKLLNVPGDIEPEVNTALDEKPTMDEMVRVIKGLKDGKAPGGDGIPAEVWKYGELICPTDCTDGSSKYGRNAMYHKPGSMPP